MQVRSQVVQALILCLAQPLLEISPGGAVMLEKPSPVRAAALLTGFLQLADGNGPEHFRIKY